MIKARTPPTPSDGKVQLGHKNGVAADSKDTGLTITVFKIS
jgi:hypothetical protein